MVAALLEWKAKEELSNREIDKRSKDAGFRINNTRIGEYEKDEWKELSVRERRHLRRFLAFVSHSTPAKESPTYAEGVEYVAGRLSDLVEDLARITGQSSARQPKPNPGEQPVGPEDLKSRFLAAIADYSDLEVEQHCGLNHETVRQYKKEWPARGPNRASSDKMQAMIEIHEALLEAESIVTGGEIPPRTAGLITLAEALQEDPNFVKEYPKLGWISIADVVAKYWRDLDLLTIHDEFAWLGYKRAHHFDPETASRVTPEDIGLDMDDIFPGDSEQTGSDE